MRERYGVDAPHVVTTFVLLGAVSAAAVWPAGWLVARFAGDTAGRVVGVVVGCCALLFWVQQGWMLIGSVVGKRRLWRRLLDGLELRGDERVLEVGPGRGAVLVEAARRLPAGRAIGVDLWRRSDQSGNAPDALRRNATIAAVADRLTIVSGDMSALPLGDASVDVVLASLAVHNLPEPGQEATFGEILRVLAPGGRLVVLDFQHTARYARWLTDLGAIDVSLGPLRWQLHPPVRVVTARRAAQRPGDAPARPTTGRAAAPGGTKTRP